MKKAWLFIPTEFIASFTTRDFATEHEAARSSCCAVVRKYISVPVKPKRIGEAHGYGNAV